MRLFFIAFLSLTALFSSCSKQEVPEIEIQSDYFQLAVGNYWQLGQRRTYEVTGTAELGGKAYHLISETADNRWRDSTYYRLNNGKVYAIQGRNKEEGEGLMFDLTAEEGESWMYHSYKVTLQSRNEKVTFNGREIKNCYKFYLDVPQTADEEYWVWLAPGIGFIQLDCSFCVDPMVSLVKARIDGKEL